MSFDCGCTCRTCGCQTGGAAYCGYCQPEYYEAKPTPPLTDEELEDVAKACLAEAFDNDAHMISLAAKLRAMKGQK